MRVGVFTPLLSQLSLDDVLKKLKSYDIDRVELGTGNYPGGAHCKLSMLDNPAELAEFQGKLKDSGVTIQRVELSWEILASGQGNAEAMVKVSRDTIRLASKLGVKTVVDFSGCPGDFAYGYGSELGDLSVAA